MMPRLLLAFLIWIHNLTYRLIGILAIKENGGIHPKHRILNYHDFFLKNIRASDDVLDIGCGNGACACAIAQKAARVTGIDISPKNIGFARKKFSRGNLEYIIGDATKYNFSDKFDAIILSNVLEHIDNRVELLKKIRQLAPKILIRVPLLTRDWLAVYKKEKGYDYRLDKTHFLEYTEETFESEMEKSGLYIQDYYTRFGELYAVVRHRL